MCIMTQVWQVLQGEGDLWGHYPMSPLFKTLIVSFFGGESKNAESLLWGLSLGVGQ